jgi:hypothetical protein
MKIEKEKKPSNILYYKISVSSSKIKTILEEEESIDTEFKSNLEKLKKQDEFHITLYFPGNENQFENEYSNIPENTKCMFHITSIGLSDKSCVMCIDDEITYDSGNGDIPIPYHGNEIRHITIASADGIKPVDSPKALTEGIEYILRNPVFCYGDFNIVRKKFSRRKTVVTEK